MTYKIGIDVGGTNTDAVVLDGRRVVASVKSPTTQDVTTGILNALTSVLNDAHHPTVSSVFIGTTHFINAIAQRRNLARVAVVRLATPPQSLGPMVDWPEDLRGAVNGGTYICAGGAQFDGSLLSELDEHSLRGIAEEIRQTDIRHVALSSVFSPVNADPEKRAEEILREELPGVSITPATKVGQVGLLARENAAILNAALLDLAGEVVDGLEKVVCEAGVTAPILLSQNDGTVMTVDRARQFPIFTVASGPTNSMRGAALLTGIDNAVVVDVGGTTSDIGLLQNGFPRESTVALDLAGVRSNFRVPDVLSLALGGGTRISDDGETVGPESVGFRITQEAKVFGGPSLTFTDIAVASGVRGIGEPGAAVDIPSATVSRSLEIAGDLLVRTIDRAKLSSRDVPVIAVGGGASLLSAVPVLEHLNIPENAGVANAVGAAFAEAGAEVDTTVFLDDNLTRSDALDQVKAEAVSLAIEAGADPENVRFIEVEDIPLAYLPGGMRIRVRVVGPFVAPAETAERTK